jgi:hypothetical protein
MFQPAVGDVVQTQQQPQQQSQEVWLREFNIAYLQWLQQIMQYGWVSQRIKTVMSPLVGGYIQIFNQNNSSPLIAHAALRSLTPLVPHARGDLRVLLTQQCFFDAPVFRKQCEATNVLMGIMESSAYDSVFTKEVFDILDDGGKKTCSLYRMQVHDVVKQLSALSATVAAMSSTWATQIFKAGLMNGQQQQEEAESIVDINPYLVENASFLCSVEDAKLLKMNNDLILMFWQYIRSVCIRTQTDFNSVVGKFYDVSASTPEQVEKIVETVISNLPALSMIVNGALPSVMGMVFGGGGSGQKKE